MNSKLLATELLGICTAVLSPGRGLLNQKVEVPTMLSRGEQEVLKAFRDYLIKPGEMLCFHGQKLEEYDKPLHSLAAKELVLKERLEGAYSLTQTGYAALSIEIAQRGK